MPLDLASHQMLALTRSSLLALRAALIRDAGPGAAAYLQEAGYAGGEAMWQSFQAWLEERGGDVDSLDLAGFEEMATEYFREAGWGSLNVGTLHDAVATLDSTDWGEADPSSGLDHPGCGLTTGMFADFFGRLGGEPLAVLEVECRSMGHARCRFLVGSAEFMQELYDELGRGVGYNDALETISG